MDNATTHGVIGEVQDSDSHQTLSLLIVSGRSGSGKTSVINILEDFGYYAIDNLPLSLVVDTVDTLQTDTQLCNIALGVDIRTPKADLSDFARIYEQLITNYGHTAIKVIYVTAQEGVLVARFDATRRIHPLMASIHPLMENINNLPNALKKEIQLLEPIASHADITIDTSSLNIHELKTQLRQYLGVENQLTINVLSFGFKHGSPIDADFVFDVRILPNPHWEQGLRQYTGLDQPVQQFFAKYSEVAKMQQDISLFLNRWLPEFVHNNRHTVTIAIGCTGGKHRSVFIAEAVGEVLGSQLPNEMVVTVKHREKKRWVTHH